jgi:small-conductance mechanosensitive channel
MQLLTSYLVDHAIQFLLSLVTLALYFIFQRIVIPRLEAFVQRDSLKNMALRKAVNIFRLLLGILSLTVILFIWGFDFKWLFAVSSGLIALTGVALFANWSVLSNITAFFILLAHESYKRGVFIRIIEADNYAEGFIVGINIFSTTLLTESREYINYPNNLLITRPTMISPKRRFNSIGKIQEFVLAKDEVKSTDPTKE